MSSAYSVKFDSDRDDDAFKCHGFGADDAAYQFLTYVYDNCDGWEWMPKDNGKSVIVVKDETGAESKYTFELEYTPSFCVWEAK